MAVVSSNDFVKEISKWCGRKHSKNHPIIGMIEEGKLDREAAQRLRRPVLSVFPQAVSQTDRRDAGRCPDDPELEKMWIENVVEEGTGEITGTDSHKALFIRFAKACGLRQ